MSESERGSDRETDIETDRQTDGNAHYEAVLLVPLYSHRYQIGCVSCMTASPTSGRY